MNLYRMVGNDLLNTFDKLGLQQMNMDWLDDFGFDHWAGFKKYQLEVECEFTYKGKCVCKYGDWKEQKYRLPDLKETLYIWKTREGGPVIIPGYGDFVRQAGRFFDQARARASAIFANNPPRTWQCSAGYTRVLMASFCKCRIYAVNKNEPNVAWY